MKTYYVLGTLISLFSYIFSILKVRKLRLLERLNDFHKAT